jgi:hypothetical protein
MARFVIIILLLVSCQRANGQNYYPSAVDCRGNAYSGRERAYAKTHRSKGPLYVTGSVDDLLTSEIILPDSEMRRLDPPLSLHEESRRRVPEEDRDIEVELAYIYGIYRDPSNDYHVILGNGELSPKKMRLMSAIVSALPGDDIDETLERVRTQVVERYGDIPCYSNKYKPVEYLTPVRITGSLFFDVGRMPGVAGFDEFRPKTCWQIRPVLSIEFLEASDE